MNRLRIILLAFSIISLSCCYSYAQTNTKPVTDSAEKKSLITTLNPNESLEDFNKLLNTDKFVLVDFYADWCIPCQKLAPVIKDLANDMADKITVIRVNQDNNKALMDQLKVDELPTLLIYQKQTVKWTGIGYFSKDLLKEQFK